jgi:DNA-binding response OmpR family regulator
MMSSSATRAAASSSIAAVCSSLGAGAVSAGRFASASVSGFSNAWARRAVLRCGKPPAGIGCVAVTVPGAVWGRDDELRQELVGQLRADGQQARPSRTMKETRCRAGHGPDLLLLGELDDPTAALRLLRELRTGDALVSRADPALPVIVLIPDDGQRAALRALEAGADDCVRRAVSYLELRARLRAVLRRTKHTLTATPRRVGQLALDPMRQEVRFAGRPLQLARYEYLLLTYLPAEPERVFTKRQLLRDIWGYRTEARTRTLDAHACRLRKKEAQAGGCGRLRRQPAQRRLPARGPAPGRDRLGAGRCGRRQRVGLPDRAGPSAACGGVGRRCAARSG